MFLLRFVFFSTVLTVSANFAAAQVAATPAPTDLLLDPIVQSSSVLGHPLSFEEKAQSLPSGLGVMSEIQTQFLGNTTSLVSASVEAVAPPQSPPPAGAGSSGIDFGRTDLYIGGTRVWAGDLRFQNGSLNYSGGVAPTQIPFPLFAYPLGPLLLEVDAGVEFEGDLVASLKPGLSLPIQDSSLTASVQAQLGAAGYMQAFATLFVVRGGVGGRVDVVQGSTGVEARWVMNGQKPFSQYLGSVVLLRGNLYGFVDTNLLFGQWVRVIRKNFFSWPGKCFAFGANACG